MPLLGVRAAAASGAGWSSGGAWVPLEAGARWARSADERELGRDL